MRLAIGQMTSGRGHAGNIAVLRDYAARAAEGGAQMLCLPEVAGMMEVDAKALARAAGTADDDPWLAAASEVAADHGLWLHAGSTPIAGPGGKFYNHNTVFAPDGTQVARYDKIHLFDVALDGEEPTGESRRYAPGDRAVVLDTPLGRFGLTICYDLRFPALFRAEAQAGAQVIFVPSAFTVPTGRAHWEVLLRARAIETGAFIVAPAQVGQHEDGRATWGHSLAVSPWGKVLTDLGGDGPALGLVDLDLSDVTRARRQIPALTNDRAFALDHVSWPG